MASPTQSTPLHSAHHGVYPRYCIADSDKNFCVLVLTSDKTPAAKKIATIAAPFNAIQRGAQQ